MTDHKKLIAEARERANPFRMGKSTDVDTDRDILMIRRLANALEAATSGMSTEWATAFVDENGKIGDPEYYYTHRSDAEDEASGSDAEGARILTRQVTPWKPVEAGE